MLNVIIVDDELAGRRTLREFCAAESDLNVVGEFGDGTAALAAIREIADRLDGKARQESEISLRTAVARELTDDALAAIAVGGDGDKVEPDTMPDPTKH